MTKKTRIRVARIAAGAVIAAGASLTAAGAASAVGIEVPGVAGVEATADDSGIGISGHIGPNDEDETEEPCIPGSPGCEEPPTEEPPTEEPPTEEPPTEEPPTEEPPTEDPTDEPTSDPSDDPGNGNGGNGNGGNGNGGNDTDPDGGNQPVEQGGKEGLQDTGDAPAGGGELAETGAAETTFLLIGAATMIAGGIGFRMLPRLASGRNNIAA